MFLLYCVCIRTKLSFICKADGARLHNNALSWATCHLMRVTVPSCQRGQLTYRNVERVRSVEISGREHATPSITRQMLQLGLRVHLNLWSFELMIKSRKRHPWYGFISSNSHDGRDPSK